jgi:hypothetical protein
VNVTSEQITITAPDEPNQLGGEVAFELPDSLWHATGHESDPGARLLMTMRINGVPHHLEAVAVENHADFQELAKASGYEADAVWDLFSASGHMDVMTIKGRSYILLMSPYC